MFVYIFYIFMWNSVLYSRHRHTQTPYGVLVCACRFEPRKRGTYTHCMAHIAFIMSYIPCNIDGEIYAMLMHSQLNTSSLSLSGIPWSHSFSFPHPLPASVTVFLSLSFAARIRVFVCVYMGERMYFAKTGLLFFSSRSPLIPFPQNEQRKQVQNYNR